MTKSTSSAAPSARRDEGRGDDERSRALRELGELATGAEGGRQREFEEALRCERLQNAHAALAGAVERRSRRSAYDTGRTEAIEAPPGWLPPVV